MIKTQLRTSETFDKYMKHKKLKNKPCFFCFSKTVRIFKFWKLKKNDFPYDKIAREHVMLSPYEHITRKEDLIQDAKLELEEILKMYDKEEYYDTILENFNSNRTIKDHYHIHLLKYITNVKK